ASFIQLDAQCRLVERFEEARAESAMHLDRCTDDPLGDAVEVFELCASVPLWLIHRGSSICPGGRGATLLAALRLEPAGRSRGHARTPPRSADRAPRRARSVWRTRRS